MNLGEKIKQYRNEKRITQGHLGNAVGVSEKVISKWENGDTQVPVEKLPLLADAFGINIDELFGYTHDFSCDIQSSVERYMESIPPCDAVRTARELVSYIILGAAVRRDRDAGYYGEETLGELKNEWESFIKNKDERPQRYWHEENKDILHDYRNGSIDNYSCADLAFTVIQSYPDGMFEGILEKYDSFIKVFGFLARPDAYKLLRYRYSDKMPDNFTVDYISENSGASVETVNAFLDINDSLKSGQPVTIHGKKRIMYAKPTVCGAQSTLQTVIASAYAFSEKRNGGQR